MESPVNKIVNKRIQTSIIKHLQKYGTLQLLLPDNNVLEIGILEEDENGKARKTDSYCYVIVKNELRATVIDKYNLGIRYSADEKVIVLEDKFVDQDGKNIKSLNVV